MGHVLDLFVDLPPVVVPVTVAWVIGYGLCGEDVTSCHGHEGERGILGRAKQQHCGCHVDHGSGSLAIDDRDSARYGHEESVLLVNQICCVVCSVEGDYCSRDVESQCVEYARGDVGCCDGLCAVEDAHQVDGT